MNERRNPGTRPDGAEAAPLWVWILAAFLAAIALGLALHALGIDTGTP